MSSFGYYSLFRYQFSSVAQLCPTLCNPMDHSMPGFPVHHHLPEFTQLMSIESVMPSNHLILCCPLLFLPSIFPSIRVFSNESALCIRWPKYWSFSFSISPSNEYLGLLSCICFSTAIFPDCNSKKTCHDKGDIPRYNYVYLIMIQLF